jgi:hypothetical protein
MRRGRPVCYRSKVVCSTSIVFGRFTNNMPNSLTLNRQRRDVRVIESLGSVSLPPDGVRGGASGRPLRVKAAVSVRPVHLRCRRVWRCVRGDVCGYYGV